MPVASPATMPTDPLRRALLQMLLVSALPLTAWTVASPHVHVGELAALVTAYLLTTAVIVASVSVAPSTQMTERPTALRLGVAAVALALLSSRMPPAVGGVVGSFAVLLGGATLGSKVAGGVLHPGHLLPVALLSAAVDLWSVSAPQGVTHQITQTPSLLNLLTLRVAIPPSRAPEPMIGFGDVVFAALYHHVSRRLGLPLWRTRAALAAGLVLAGVAALVAELPGGVPALPFLGVTVVLSQRATWSVPERDRRATWFAAAVLAASVARVAIRGWG